MLTERQRQHLLRVARASIETHLAGGAGDAAPDPDLPGASGVFVTIKQRGALRGCLGTLALTAPLDDEVARCARDSATRDPRFPPIQLDEWLESTLEILVLGPLEVIDPGDEAAVTLGRHGLVVERGRQRGLLLPQVAVEWGWTREQFLRQTCRKAGLPDDAWRNGARVFRFDADVFGE
jgi:AmmeMemoRadiSam system protein A